jgi:hypothetical protein
MLHDNERIDELLAILTNKTLSGDFIWKSDKIAGAGHYSLDLNRGSYQVDLNSHRVRVRDRNGVEVARVLGEEGQNSLMSEFEFASAVVTNDGVAKLQSATADQLAYAVAKQTRHFKIIDDMLDELKADE